MVGVKLCPICKTPMVYIQETERAGDERRIVRYYKCPACGTRVIDEVLKVRRVNGSIVILIEQNGSGKVIQSQRPQRRQKPSRIRKIK
jgi:transcriptional regulator NrdR family protein